MNKEKILEKSRLENMLGDERKTAIDSEALIWTCIGGAVAFIFIIILSWFKNIDTSTARLMMATMFIAYLACQLIRKWKERNTLSNILNSIILIVLIFSLIIFIVEMI